MKQLALAAFIATLSLSADAADHQWQHGIWRDVQTATVNGGALSVPVGVAVAGMPPAYLSLPLDDDTEVITVDGPNGLRYVARSRHRFNDAVMNDPVQFAIEGTHLFVRGSKAGQTFKLTLVKTIRLPN